MSSDGYAGSQNAASGNNDYNATSFLIAKMLAQMTTAEIVRVEKVDVAAKKVDVLPLVHMVDGKGQELPHGVIVGLPYARLQTGLCAVIMDPTVGDIGLAVFASRDISTVVATQAPALPGSARRFDWGDGVYFGGLLNQTPTQYIEMTEAAINIKTPTVNIDATNVNCTGTLNVATDVIVNGRSFNGHRHGGVQTGGGNTGTPV